MSWIIQKSNKNEIWNNTIFPSFEVAKNNLVMAYPKRSFKRSDDDLTWHCALHGTRFSFVELKDYQEKPVLTVDELLKPDVDVKTKLIEIFHRHSYVRNVHKYKNTKELNINRSIIDFEWTAMANDILKLFQVPLAIVNLPQLSEEERREFYEKWQQVMQQSPRQVINNISPRIQELWNVNELKLLLNNGKVRINEVEVEYFDKLDESVFNLNYITHNPLTYHFSTVTKQ